MAELASHDPSVERGLTPLYLLKLTAVLAVVCGGMLYAAQRYTLGIDSQWFRCMAEKYFVIDNARVPNADEIAPLQVLAFAMGPAQEQIGLGWSAGDTMAKRVLATEPGTEITVALDGVYFSEPGGREWKFGSGLEAADVIGARPEDFLRTITLAEGEFWAMGDMPFSVDSRYYGPVSIDQLTGTVVLKW